MTKLFPLFASALLPLLSLAAPPPSELAVPDFKTYVFADSVPAEFTAGAHSTLSLSDKVWRDQAKSSLRWDWDAPGATLTYKHPEAFKRLTGEKPDPIIYESLTVVRFSGFSLWIFNETPSDGTLRFEIGDGKTVDSKFWMNLSFSGWRELTFLYGRDLDGFPNQKTADTLRIIAPDDLINQNPSVKGGRPKGTVYLSHFAPRREIWGMYLNDATPWVANSPARRHLSAALSPALPVASPGALSPEQVKQLKELSARVLGKAPDLGVGKTSKAQVEAFKASLAKDYGFRKKGALLLTNLDVAPKAAEAARLCLGADGDPELQAELKTLLLDLLEVQRPIPLAAKDPSMAFDLRLLRALKDSFKRSGQWDELMDKTRRLYGIDGVLIPQHWECTEHNFQSQERQLRWILLEDDTPRKWSDLQALQRRVEQLAGNGVIQSDGSVFWHDMLYEGYGFPTLYQIVIVVPLLHGTPFACPKMEAMAKTAVKALVWRSCPWTPHFFGGRHRGPGRVDWNFGKALLGMASCGEPFDREMASMLLALADRHPKESANDPDVARFKALGVKPADLEGHFPLNYACAGIQRRGDWLLAVRGQKRGFGASDTYSFAGENTLGRFLNYGHIILLSPDTLDFVWSRHTLGLGPQGWNWALWPGTTSRLLPHDVLRGRFEVDEAITSEPFCGDTALDGDGVWGMKLQEEIPGSIDPIRIGPVKYWLGDKLYDKYVKDGHYDKDFRARKSVFMFGDHAVCLGSGVKSSDSYPAVTTLFQNFLGKAGQKELMNSTPQSLMPWVYQRSIGREGLKESFKLADGTDPVFPLESDLKGATWMIDSSGTGYLVPANNDPLRLERKFQKLPFHYYWSPNIKPEMHDKVASNEGDVEVAYFNHGVKPDNGGYEYAMFVKATPERMEAFAKAPPYEVRRCDNTAHVVRDPASKTTGYVVFEPGKEIGGGLGVASAPCLVMLKELDGGKRKMSFCNPDLGRQYAACGPDGEAEQLASVTMPGVWKVVGGSKEAKATTKDGLTTIEFRTFGATPATLTLEGVVAVAKPVAAKAPPLVPDPAQSRPWLPKRHPLDAAEREALDKFSAIYAPSEIHPNGKGAKKSELRELAALTRPGNEPMRKLEVELAKLTPGQVARRGRPGALALIEVMRLFARLAACYADATPAEAEQVKAMTLGLCRQLLDAGVGEGDPRTFRSLHAQAVPSGGIDSDCQRGLFGMRSELQAAGLLEPMVRAVLWWDNPEYLQETIPAGGSDNLWVACPDAGFVALASLPDGPEKLQLVQMLQRHFSLMLESGGAMHASGEAINHGGFHLAYTYLMPRMLQHMANLKKAGFPVSPEAEAHLRAFGRLTAHILMDKKMSPNLWLRAGSQGICHLADRLAILADMGAPDGKGVYDREMAGLFLTVAEEDKSLDLTGKKPPNYWQKPVVEAARRYREAGLTPLPLAGCHAMPARPGLVWRGGEWMLSAAGLRAGFSSIEMYAGGSPPCNSYVCNGSLLAMRQGDPRWAVGFEPDKGWNWCLWPAATTLLKPDHEMMARHRVEHAIRNGSSIGGVAVLGDTGLLAVDFKGMGPKGEGLSFHKSIALLDGRALVMTSGITSAIDRPCVTTLYQEYLDSPAMPTWVDGKRREGLSGEERPDSARQLVDAQGLGYTLLQADPGTLRLFRRPQQWRTPGADCVKPGVNNPVLLIKADVPNTANMDVLLNDFIPRQGDFATAYLDHGVKPKDAACAFVVSLNPKAKTPPPRVDTMTTDAHAAYDPASRTWVYASFKPDVAFQGEGPVSRLGRSAAVLVKQLDGGRLNVAVESWENANPAPYTLVLKGSWKLDSGDGEAKAGDGVTSLSIPYAGDRQRTATLIDQSRSAR